MHRWSWRMTLSALTACLIGAPTGAHTLDGGWVGELGCSESLTNRSPGYSVPLELRISGTVGHGERIDGVAEEIFALDRLSSGEWQLRSSGRLKSDTGPRWVTRFTGRLEENHRLVFSGEMRSGDGRTLVRERCVVTLHRAPRLAGSDPRRPPIVTDADHRSLRIVEVAPRVRPMQAAQLGWGPGGLPRGSANALYLPEDWLLGEGQPWFHRTRANPDAVPVPIRAPDTNERQVLERARALMQRIESRVMVLVADGAIVEVISTGGIRPETLLLSASMAKTVTALAAGKAICAGHLTLDTRADALLPALAGTDLGTASLRDLLMMASGTTEPASDDYVGTTPEEIRHHLEGPGSLEMLLSTPRQSTAHRGLFGKVRPGERFSYKARDPYTVAMMLERSVGMPTARWIERALLAPVGTEHAAVLGTDRRGYFQGANGSVRLALIDWIRLALHVEEQRRSDSCFGRFVRDMGTTKIHAPGVMNSIRGYGYLTWTDNALAPETFWAAGYGGQRIGWSSDPANRRIFLLFSNSADRETDAIYPLAADWFALGRRR